MKSIFEKIWDIAEEYQDKRDDEGHAKTVLEYAIKLLKIIPANENLVIPAAILHDIGWSKLSKEDSMKIFSDDISDEEKILLRIKHEKEGSKLAEELLNKIGYQKNLIPKITGIIDGHDTRKEFLNKEDGIVRDADRLSIFSRWGVKSDLSIRKDISPKDYLDLLENKLHNKYRFCFNKSKEMAIEELKDRRKEYEC